LSDKIMSVCKAEEFRDITVNMNMIQDTTFLQTKFIKRTFNYRNKRKLMTLFEHVPHCATSYSQ